MNKYKYQLIAAYSAVSRQIRQHADIVASTACGALMAVLFITFLNTYQARQASMERPLQIDLHSRVVVLGDANSSSSSSSVSPVIEIPFSSLPSSSSSSYSRSPAPLRPAAPASSEPAIEVIVPSSSSVRSSITVSSEPIASSEPVAISTSSSSSISPSSSSSIPVSSSIASSQASSSSSTAPIVQSSSSAASVSSIASSTPAPTGFPTFDHTSWPVGKTPNWGAMRTPQEWNRPYSQMTREDFVSIPSYNMGVLTTPMSSLTNPLKDENIPAITAKLFYSTRFYSTYDLDAAEHTGEHVGVDLKLARGTPIGAIAGGRVTSVTKTQRLGLHVVIEHRLKNGEVYFSIYGHFDSAAVSPGQDVKPGQTVGYVGMTGNTSAPHLHLQIDLGTAGENHLPYEGAESDAKTVHPITFLGKWRSGE